MTKTVSLVQGMNKSSQQYHSITLMSGQPKIRDFVNAMKQHLHKYHGRRVSFSYRWCRHKDGSLFFALSGSRSVQDVFAAYLNNNQGSYYTSATVTQYGRCTDKFNRAFDKLFEMKCGRSARGEIK